MFLCCKFFVFVSSALWLYLMMYILVYVIVFCVVNICMLPQPGKNGYADWYEFKSKIKSNQIRDTRLRKLQWPVPIGPGWYHFISEMYSNIQFHTV